MDVLAGEAHVSAWGAAFVPSLRRDEVGVLYGYDRRDPSTGTGGCNGCQGGGPVPCISTKAERAIF